MGMYVKNERKKHSRKMATQFSLTNVLAHKKKQEYKKNQTFDKTALTEVSKATIS